MMTLWHAGGSTHSATVRMVLAAKGLEYRSRELDLERFEQADPEFLQLNPAGQVPVLDDDDHRLTEAFFIALYLDERYPQPPLGGLDAQTRYQVQKWGKYVETHIAPHLAIVRWAALRGKMPAKARPGLDRLPPERAALWQRAANGFGPHQLEASTRAMIAAGERIAADLQGGGWLAGDQFTLADIAVYPHVAQFETFGVPLPKPIGAWLTRVAEGPWVRGSTEEMAPAAVMGPEPGRWG